MKERLVPAAVTRLIHGELARVAGAIRREIEPLSSALGLENHPLAAPGKLLRPTLALLSARAVSRRTKGTIRLATALELLHLATLAHDDLLDGAEVRRGLPTINRQLGGEAALLAGDYLFARATVTAVGLPRRVAADFADLICTLVSGELSQLRARVQHPGTLPEVSVQDYLATVGKKTASFTAVCCRLGAACAGSDAATIRTLESFGYSLGMAFQIIDDTMDVTGSPEKLRKPVGQDAKSGVITLPVLYALSSPRRPTWLPGLVAGFEPTEGNLALLREACSLTDATSAALALAESYLAAAQDSLATLAAAPAVSSLAVLAASLGAKAGMGGGAS